MLSSRSFVCSLRLSMYFLDHRLSLTFCLTNKLGSKITGWGQVGMSWRLWSIKHVAQLFAISISISTIYNMHQSPYPINHYNYSIACDGVDRDR